AQHTRTRTPRPIALGGDVARPLYPQVPARGGSHLDRHNRTAEDDLLDLTSQGVLAVSAARWPELDTLRTDEGLGRRSRREWRRIRDPERVPAVGGECERARCRVDAR